MSQGLFKTIILSLLVHIVLFYLISNTVTTPHIQNKNTSTPIKSFIYTPPKKVPEVISQKEKAAKEELSTPEIKPQETQPQEIQHKEEKRINTEETLKKANIPPQTNNEMLEEQTVAENNTEQEQIKNLQDQTRHIPSTLTQLKSLQERLNEKMFEEETFKYHQKKSGSVMHGEPNTVPHSTRQYTQKEIKQRNTQQISADMAITKEDDGTCSIERDLSAVGMEGLKSVETFACGKSKFDAAFKAHMKKVREKLGK